jgi:hypothetical protein
MVAGSVVLMNSVAPLFTPPHAGVSAFGVSNARIGGFASTAAVATHAATVQMQATPFCTLLNVGIAYFSVTFLRTVLASI